MRILSLLLLGVNAVFGSQVVLGKAKSSATSTASMKVGSYIEKVNHTCRKVMLADIGLRVEESIGVRGYLFLSIDFGSLLSPFLFKSLLTFTLHPSFR
jgi:hypothetical protein